MVGSLRPNPGTDPNTSFQNKKYWLPETNRNPKTMKRTILPIIAFAAMAFGVISVVRSQPRRESNVPPSQPPVSPYAQVVAAEGLVEASSENISIGTSLSEVVTEVPVAVGQKVKTGEPLFRLDDRQ